MYKRQVHGSINNTAGDGVDLDITGSQLLGQCFGEAVHTTLGAVSYTHLDVYKRQVGACAALTNVFICVALGAGVGAGVLVSRYFGAKEYGKMKTIVSTSLISFLLLSILLGIFGFCFSHAMMSGLQTPADILDEAVLYLRVYFVGFPFLFMYNILSTMFTSIGESKIPLGLLLSLIHI